MSMRETLSTEKKLLGTMLSEVYFPNMSMILINCGYDFIIIDCEHGPYDYTQVSVIISMAKSSGLSAIVRIPEIRREPILKYLDMGADGLLVPMVKNAEDAAAVIEYAKYPPLGNRGISISRAHSKYDPKNISEYLTKANRHTAILIQIELTSALKEVEKIAALPGVDAVMVGPSDLSMDLGVFNKLDAPLILSAIHKTAAAAALHQKSSGIITADTELIKSSLRAGMNLVCAGSESRALIKGFTKSADEFRSIL